MFHVKHPRRAARPARAMRLRRADRGAAEG